MDVGTGKDLSDYVVNKQIPYHLIDIADAGEKYNLFRYQQDFHAAYEDIVSRGIVPILCGGTGLYIEAVLKGYALSPVPQNEQLRQQLSDKSLAELTDILVDLKHKNHSVMHNQSDVDTAQRAIRAIEIETHLLQHPMSDRALPPVDACVIGLRIDRDERRKKIEEVQGLLAAGIPPENLIYYGLEYKYVTEYVIGKTTYGEMFQQLEIAIHQFAKRQMTWFRGMERRGFAIHWIDATLPMEEKITRTKEIYGY